MRKISIKTQLRVIVCYIGVIHNNLRHRSIHTRRPTKKRKRNYFGIKGEEVINAKATTARFIPINKKRGFAFLKFSSQTVGATSASLIQLRPVRLYQLIVRNSSLDERNQTIRARVCGVIGGIALP